MLLPRWFVPLLVMFAPLASATSVVPPNFPELVSSAEAIYRGRVTAVQARRVEGTHGQESVIKTFVTLAIERTLKGVERAEVTLEFLGGTVGEEKWEVDGMPTFDVGAREIVFVERNGVQFCPLVGLMHGRYRVLRDEATGREHIARDNRLPLTNTSDVELPAVALPGPVRAAAAAPALTAAEFETSIASEVRQPTRAARPN